MTETPDHVALTIDGSVPADRAGAMRWMPPEQAAAELAAAVDALNEAVTR